MQHCVSIIETGLDEALEASRKAVAIGADLIEVRFDHLPSCPRTFPRSRSSRSPR